MSPGHYVTFETGEHGEFFNAAGTGDNALLLHYLNDLGYDPNLPDSDGDTALFWAASRNSLNTAKTLLNYGANPNIEGNTGNFPLGVAAQFGFSDMVALLLDNGADINHVIRGHDSALNLAIKGGQRDVAALLIRYGADVNMRYHDEQETALMSAALRGYPELVLMLIQHGADVNAQDRDGDTAIFYYTLGRTLDPETAKILVVYGASIDAMYSQGVVFTRFVDDFSIQQEFIPRELATADVLLNNDIAVMAINPSSRFYRELCW